MKLLVTKKLLFSLVAGIIVVGILPLTFYWTAAKVKSTNDLIEHTHKVLIQSNQILTDVINIQAGSRGYVITGDENFMGPYNSSSLSVNATIDSLANLTSDNPRHQTRIDSLRKLINQRINFSKKTIDLRKKEGAKAASDLVITAEGQNITDRIRSVIAEINKEENQLLLQRKSENEKSIKIFQVFFVFLVSSLVIIILVVIYIALQNSSKQKKFDDELTKLNNELERKVLLRTNELEKVKNSLSEIIERVTDAFVALDKDWCYTYANKKAAAMVGRLPEDLIGKNIWELFPESVGTPFHKAFVKAMSSQEFVFLEEHYAPFNKWFENHIYPSAEGLSVFIHETTDKKIAEEELRSKGNFIESIIHASPDIIYIYDIEEQKNVFVNEGMQKNLGYSDAEIKEMGDQVLPLLMHPEDFQFYLKHTFPRYANTKDNEIIQHEFRMRAKNNDWHWLSCKESIFLRTAVGTPKQVFGITVDITDLKKAENELIETNFSLSESQRIAKTGSWTYYLNGELKWSDNVYRLYGLPSDITETTPELFFELVHADDREKMQKWMQAILAGEAPGEYEFRSVLPDGSMHYYRGSGELKYDRENKPAYLRGTVQDITERKKAEQEILQMNEQLRNLSSHLQNIREEEQTRIAREIHDELGQQLTALSIEISNLNKLAGNAIPKTAEKISSLKELVNTTIATVRKIATQLRPGILDDLGLVAALEWQFAEFENSTGIKCVFDAWVKKNEFPQEISTAVFRIAQESLTNISRHSGATEAKAILYEKENNLILEINDNGKGISTVSAGKKTFGILGMRERAAMLNGEFSLINNAKGGTCVTLKLPLP